MQLPDSEPPYPNDRRAHPRAACDADSRIAPYVPGMALGNLQFEPVKLKDLSAGGLSFWTTAWPRYGEVAFPLMDHGGEGLMLAHVRKVDHVAGRYLVHCQFVGRLSE